jgi:hypothetical protein
VRTLDGIVNAVRLLRRPRAALSLLGTRPGLLLGALSGKVDLHFHV